MSEDSAQQLMEMYDKWDSRENRRKFLSRMEHKHKRRAYDGI